MEELETLYDRDKQLPPIDTPDISVFKAAFDHAADGLIVLNANRRVLYMNPAAEKMIDIKNPIGEHCGTLMHCHDDNHGALRYGNCYGLGVLETHKSLTHVDMNIVSSTGEAVPVEVTYSYIPGQDGAEYLLMSLRNVSIRKEMEKVRRQKEAFRYTLQERERLARDLHDGVVQDIAYANMKIKLLIEDLHNERNPDIEDIQKISSILEGSFLELRGAIHDLTFNVEVDLSTFIEQYLLDYENRTDIRTTLSKDESLHAIEPFMTSQIAKIVQEALTNIRKHANATDVHIQIRSQQQNILVLTIEDNGKGFAADKDQTTDHYGMKTMRERCVLIGGEFSVHSSIGRGTKVQLLIPLH
jgi:PAS domain S-box-containing protein